MTPPPNQPPPKRPQARPENLPRITREEVPGSPQDAPAAVATPTPQAEDGDAALAERGISLRSRSPAAGMIRVEGKGWKLTMPHVALVAVLTTLGGWFGKEAASKGEQAELGDVLREVKAMRKDLADVRGDLADVREEQRKARGNDRKLLTYVDDTVTPMIASLRRLGVRLGYEGEDRAADVEFHPAPAAGSTAPPIQPRAVLPERPSL